MATTVLLSLIPPLYLLLGYGLRLRKTPAADFPPELRPLRRRMRRALSLPDDQPGVSLLRSHGPQLTQSLLALRRELRAPRAYWQQQRLYPRLLHLAQRASDALQAPEQLRRLLTEAPELSSYACRKALPLSLRLALCGDLEETLDLMLSDAADAARAPRLARRLRRAKDGVTLLQRLPMTYSAVNALLRLQDGHPGEALEAYLATLNLTPAEVTRRFAQEQARQADRIVRIASALHAAELMDWDALLESADPLHALLLTDPVYAAMNAPSRDLYRRQASLLARLFRLPEDTLVQTALALAADAPADSLERHIGWYLLEPQGQSALRKACHARRGGLGLWARRHSFALGRGAIWAAHFFAALTFLQAGYTLWLLPVFLPVFGYLTRWALRRLIPKRPLPALALNSLEEDMRTLLVLPAVLGDSHDAIRAARELSTIRQALAGSGVDCLLLGDWTPGMTLRRGEDSSVIRAALSSVEALNEASTDGTRYYYLQRSRTWSSLWRVHAPRGGRFGALEGLCQLLCRGDFFDGIDAASFTPGELRQRYAWILSARSGMRPDPDTLLKLAGTLAHPLNLRRHTHQGPRGYAMLSAQLHPLPGEERTLLQRFCAPVHFPASMTLIQPGALLEDAESRLDLASFTAAPDLWQALAGHAVMPAAVFQSPPEHLSDLLLALHDRCRDLWAVLPWQLSHVRTPRGVERNSLSSRSRLMLRGRLRGALLPLLQAILLIAAAAHHDPVVLLAALGAAFLTHRPLEALLSLMALPLQAFSLLDASLRGLTSLILPGKAIRELPPERLSTIELWSQSAYSALILWLSMLGEQLFLPGFVLAAAFLSLPFLHSRLDGPVRLDETISGADESFLREIAASTWRFFEHAVTEETHHLPPDFRQLQPAAAQSEFTSPGSLALYLLACLGALEAELIDATACARRLADMLRSLEALHRPQGLLLSSYALDTLSPAPEAVLPAADNGLLCAALLTCAQGLRAHLADVEEGLRTLPASLDALAAAMALSALYDRDAGLFRSFLDPRKSEQDAPLLHLFADEGLLLSFVAVMRREVPAEHLARLQRHRVRTGRLFPLLTRQGGAQALLPALLLPASPSTLMGRMGHTMALLQRRESREGLWGKGECACYAFDSQLRYVTGTFGLADAALQAPSAEPVYAPWASALMLPFDPPHALESLRRMKSLGMLGRQGFLEAVDFEPSRLPEHSSYALVRLQSAAHQGIILCAVCHMLTEGAIVRHFSALPMARAAALMLRDEARPLILPAPTRFPAPQAHREPSWQRAAQSFCAPLDAHMLGSPGAAVIINSQGSGALRFRGHTLTHFTGDASALEGPQLYLIRQEQIWRLTDPSLDGETIFTEGAARFTRRMGRLTCSLTILTDPSADAVLYMVEISSDDPLDAEVEIVDCLIPTLDAPVERPSPRMLMLRMDEEALAHSVHTDDPLLALSVQTDREAFLGRGTFAQPDSLLHPCEGTDSAYHGVCLSFRLRMSVPAHGKRRVTFATRLQNAADAAYLPGDPSSQLTIARLHARTLTDSLGISQEEAANLSTLLGAMCWRGQLHQGAAAPLQASSPVTGPVLTVALDSPEGLALLAEAAALAGWIRLTGLDALLCVDCPEDMAEAAQEALPSGLPAHILTQITPEERDALYAASRLVLQEGDGPAAAQLARQELPAHIFPQPTAQVFDEEPELLFDSGISGFEAQTGECVIRRGPELHPLRPWRHSLTGSRFITHANDGALGASAAASHPVTDWERVYLTDEDNRTLCSLTPEPLGQALHWRIRVAPGMITWQTGFSGLDTTLTAACMPRHTCGLRALRIKNTTKKERHVTLRICAAFASGASRAETFLTPIGMSLLAQHPGTSGTGFLALTEGQGRASAASPLGFGPGDAPRFLTSEKGSIGMLEIPLTLAPGGSTSLTWLTGYAAQADEIDLALGRLKRSGASAVFRSLRQQWGQRREVLILDTPEESLNLLLNHWLPAQFLTNLQPLATPACCLLAPDRVRPMLLLWARDHAQDALLPYLAAAYARITGDDAALNDLVPHDAAHPADPRDTLYARCLQALHAPADGLEETLLRILSIEAFLPWTDAPDAAELEQLLPDLRAAARDIPIDAKLSALALLALGPTPETTFALRESYLRLFDPALGILRAHDDPEAPQDTLAALWMLRALASLGWTDYAWTLLRALNPIHHTDDPARVQEYRGEPWLMPSSVLGASPQAGQAGSIPSPEAAGLLYAAVAEDLLGLHREGERITLRPLLPEDWDSCAITLRQGSTVWHIDLDDRGAETAFTLADDGQPHRIHAPLRLPKETTVS